MPRTWQKGFHDAIAVETFKQFVAKNSADPSNRFWLVTHDRRMKDYARERVAGCTDVNFADSFEEVASFVGNPETDDRVELVRRLLARAKSIFFQFDDPDTLFYKWRILEEIESEVEKSDTNSDIEITRFGVSDPVLLELVEGIALFGSKISVGVADVATDADDRLGCLPYMAGNSEADAGETFEIKEFSVTWAARVGEFEDLSEAKLTAGPFDLDSSLFFDID